MMESDCLIFVYRVTAGQEKIVADVLRTKVRKENLPIYALAMIDELRGYLMVEAGDEVAVRHAAMRIPHIKGVLGKAMNPAEMDQLIEAKAIGLAFSKGDIVELISGPFKGERARIIKVEDSNRDEITVELTEVAVPIPVTVKINTLRMYQKAEK